MGIYSRVKGQVSTSEAAQHYGFSVNRQGMMCCPFHNDRKPSMKVDRNFICFGCQEKGDVIRFVSKLFGITAYEAAEKLIADMGLDRGDDARTKDKMSGNTDREAGTKDKATGNTECVTGEKKKEGFIQRFCFRDNKKGRGPVCMLPTQPGTGKTV